VTRARIEGLESNLKIELWRNHLSTNFGYTYTWPKDLTENTILKFRPRHLFYVSAFGTYGFVHASADFRFVSRIERIDENLIRLAPIVDGDQRVPIKVLDLRASYDLLGLGLPLRVGFNVNNVTDYQYVELVGNLAPGRTFVLSLDGSF
jgi:outer membrane receptor protein involved in Fe transport